MWVQETRGDIRNFCVNVRGSKCKPKSYVARDETTRQSYHIDLQLSDRSQERLEMKTHGQVITQT